MTLEKDIEKTLVTWAKGHGWLALKFTPFGDRGWPDRIFIKNGTHVWLEIKRKGEKLEPLQLYRRTQLMKHGAIIHWTDDLAEAKRLLEQYDKRPLKERLNET
jgi:hypothetical protein